ncbi:MAG: hypothetical protein SF052_11405 [Bacteroidia bacterium]|nr:hypothetical protein [Bacteroidia bacterium]
MISEIIVNRRFCGPPDSANGGYISGRLGAYFEGPSEVTLRIPPPLEVPLKILSEADDYRRLMYGDILVAEAKTTSFSLDIPQPPDFEEAQAAVPFYSGFRHHAFPGCFVCGPSRKPGDGLCIFPGKVKNREIVASPWTPDKSLDDGKGFAKREFIWAALDCPGAFTAEERYGPTLLGRLSAEILSPVIIDAPHIVIGWKEGQEGRKLFSGTAIFTAGGKLCGAAKAIWFLPK